MIPQIFTISIETCDKSTNDARVWGDWIEPIFLKLPRPILHKQCPRSISTIFECGNSCKNSWKDDLGIQLLWRVQMKRADPPHFTSSLAYWKSPRGTVASFRIPTATHSHKYGDPFTITKLHISQSRILWSCIMLSMLNPGHLPFSASLLSIGERLKFRTVRRALGNWPVSTPIPVPYQNLRIGHTEGLLTINFCTDSNSIEPLKSL